MLQRVQSIWLLIIALFAAVTFRFPFYTGDYIPDGIPDVVDLNATFTIFHAIMTVMTGALAFVNIFLYSNRKLQLKLCYVGIFFTVLLLVMYFMEINHFSNGSIALWCLFHFGILALYIMAARGIYNDEKLIKSMDRLR
jgi:peptidoglycan/LPS O-acetylase OafA/YrhL